MNKLQKLALTTGVLLTSGAAFADGSTGVGAAVTSSITAFQDDAVIAISAIGVAMITVGCLAVGFKWAKASLFS